MCIDNDNYDDGDKATYERALAIAVATTKTSTTALIIIPTTAHTHTQQPHHEWKHTLRKYRMKYIDECVHVCYTYVHRTCMLYYAI